MRRTETGKSPTKQSGRPRGTAQRWFATDGGRSAHDALTADGL